MQTNSITKLTWRKRVLDPPPQKGVTNRLSAGKTDIQVIIQNFNQYRTSDNSNNALRNNCVCVHVACVWGGGRVEINSGSNNMRLMNPPASDPFCHHRCLNFPSILTEVKVHSTLQLAPLTVNSWIMKFIKPAFKYRLLTSHIRWVYHYRDQ
jgi:hypothetical protein